MTDELIRQVTINCAERGLLLLRVRDEIRMTIAAYQTLYESSVAFGMRKALQAEQGKADMERKVNYILLVIVTLIRMFKCCIYIYMNKNSNSNNSLVLVLVLIVKNQWHQVLFFVSKLFALL